MKYNAVARNTLGGIVPYVRYSHDRGRYLLVDVEEIQDSIEVVFDLEVLPSHFIPVEDPSIKHEIQAWPASTFFSTLISMENATYSLERDVIGLIQVQVTRVFDKTTVYGRTAFVNPDVLMEDDGYIPYGTSTDIIELRRMMSMTPINP